MSEFQVGDGQLKVIVNPDDQPNEVDNIKLILTSVQGKSKTIFMTPDEALEIASALTTAIQFWLLESKDYQPILKKRKKIAQSWLKGEPNE